MSKDFNKIASLLKKAKAGIFLTGAGMSADSGIPTYRDNDGFWKKFAPYLKLGIKPIELITPHAFETTPELAWGFWEWKRRNFLENNPHQGYSIISDWMKMLPESFIHTTNIDGYHERSQTSPQKIYEVHGSIWRLQCCSNKCKTVVTNEDVPLLQLDYETMTASGSFPLCSKCQNPLRPNVLMFGDWEYMPHQNQVMSWHTFLKNHPQPNIVFMIGSNKAIPINEMIACALKQNGSYVIVINPDSKSFRQIKPDIYLQVKAKEALEKIDQLLYNI